MKGWIKFLPKEVAAPRGGEWHMAAEVVVKTACALIVRTDALPGTKAPGYGARVCDTCVQKTDEERRSA